MPTRSINLGSEKQPFSHLLIGRELRGSAVSVLTKMVATAGHVKDRPFHFKSDKFLFQIDKKNCRLDDQYANHQDPILYIRHRLSDVSSIPDPIS